MYYGYRDSLTNGHKVEPCLYCGEAPRFRQWPGRKLVIFEHKCRFVAHEDTLFPEYAQKAISEWNDGMLVMKERALKTPNA